MDFNKRITELYPELFTKGNGEEQDQFSAKWGSYNELTALTEGDIRRNEQITSLPLHSCLIHLAYLKEKAEYDNEKIKKNFKK